MTRTASSSSSTGRGTQAATRRTFGRTTAAAIACCSPTDRQVRSPAVLDPPLNASYAVTPETRDRFQHACDWYEHSRAAWTISVTLGHIAAVNAIETMMPRGWPEPSTGITLRFYVFVERAARLVPKKHHKRIFDRRWCTPPAIRSHIAAIQCLALSEAASVRSPTSYATHDADEVRGEAIPVLLP